MRGTAAIWAALGIALVAGAAPGCGPAPRPAATPGATAAIETTVGDQFAGRALEADLTRTRDIVWRYVLDAQSGDRAQMLAAYLPETRRSAETVVARDLELAKADGPLGRGLRGYSSVFLENGALMPVRAGSLVHVEDAERLAQLKNAHDDAVIVLLEFADSTSRPVFFVRNGSDWWLLP